MITSRDFEQLFERAKENDPSLIKIEIDARHSKLDFEFEKRALTQLGEALEDNSSIKELTLRSFRNEKKVVKTIEKVLEDNVVLQVLQLEDNCISEEGAIKIAEALQRNPLTSLQTLILTDNEINVEGYGAFLKSLKGNRSLTRVEVLSDLQRYTLDEKKRALCQLFDRQLDFIETGNVYHLNIKRQAERFKRNLKNLLYKSLWDKGEAWRQIDEEYRDVIFNESQTEGITQQDLKEAKRGQAPTRILINSRADLKRAKENDPTLTKLLINSQADFTPKSEKETRTEGGEDSENNKNDSYGDRLDAKTLKKLGKALKNNSHIKELSLRSFRKEKKVVEAIEKGLKNNLGLQALVLVCNGISGEGALKISEILKKKPALLKLDLTWNSMGDEGAREIAKVLQESASLLELRLEYNQIRDQGAIKIAEALQRNPSTSLQTIILTRNEISVGGYESLLKLLKKNRSLKKIEVLSVDYRSKLDEKALERCQLLDSQCDFITIGNLYDLNVKSQAEEFKRNLKIVPYESLRKKYEEWQQLDEEQRDVIFKGSQTDDKKIPENQTWRRQLCKRVALSTFDKKDSDEKTPENPRLRPEALGNRLQFLSFRSPILLSHYYFSTAIHSETAPETERKKSIKFFLFGKEPPSLRYLAALTAQKENRDLFTGSPKDPLIFRADQDPNQNEAKRGFSIVDPEAIKQAIQENFPLLGRRNYFQNLI